MRRVIPPAALLAASLAGAWLGLACATSMSVRIDEREDFSHLHTWNWLPPETRRVEAGNAEDASALDRQLERLVAEALSAQGFERVRGPADFHVTYALRVQRQLVTTYETEAEQQLSSLHSAPSFIVQASRPRVVVVETGQLVVSAVDRRRHKLVWRGELTRRGEGAFAPHLTESVARVFESFPTAATAEPQAPRPDPPAPWLRILSKRLPAAPRL
jgi:Domain of unknown function (DUF4136)